jgi:uncharacterized protein
MRVLISGASGLIGSALAPALAEAGHTIVRLGRSEPKPGAAEVRWDPMSGTLDLASLEALGGADAVVHLAGESVAAKRWTPEQKARIRDSRVKGTRLLSEALTRLANPPRVLASASAIGYYGDRGDEVLREDSPPGSDFLAEVCKAWEAATEPAARAGIRVVNHRFGLVLSPDGGVLKTMLGPFRMGVGGPLGSGKQWMSWIALDDVVGAIRHGLSAEGLQGPVNTVAPNPVTNAEFSRVLGRVLSRPAAFPVPEFALRLALGEMADAALGSQRVEPARLKETGYKFRYPELEAALRHVLEK